MRKKRKGYTKIHVAVDTVTKQVVSIGVSDEGIRDGEKFKSLVEKVERKSKGKKGS